MAAARAYLDFLNVRYYAAKGPDERMAAAGLVLRRHADLAVYESPTAWPRAFFCGAVDALHEKVEAMGGIIINDPLKIDGDPGDAAGDIDAWAKEIAQAL